MSGEKVAEDVKKDEVFVPAELEDIFRTPLEDDEDAKPAEKPAPSKEEKKEVEEKPAKEEPPVKKEEKEVDWKKRNDDTLKAFQETREENKALKESLDAQKKALEDLNRKIEEHDSELFPERIKEEKKEEESEEKKAEPADKETKRQERIAEAEELTRTVYKDYDEKVGEKGNEDAPFAKAVKENPALWNRVNGAKNPALEAYNIAKEYEFYSTYGRTPEEIEVKIREKVLKEMEESAKGTPPENKQKPKQPTTLRDIESAGADDPTKTYEPQPLEKIFPVR